MIGGNGVNNSNKPVITVFTSSIIISWMILMKHLQQQLKPLQWPSHLLKNPTESRDSSVICGTSLLLHGTVCYSPGPRGFKGKIKRFCQMSQKHCGPAAILKTPHFLPFFPCPEPATSTLLVRCFLSVKYSNRSLHAFIESFYSSAVSFQQNPSWHFWDLWKV